MHSFVAHGKRQDYTAEIGQRSGQRRANRVREMGKLKILRGSRGKNTKLLIQGNLYRRGRRERRGPDRGEQGER
jgi:hypothetical protein